MTVGTEQHVHPRNANNNERRNSQNIAYYSDEEDDAMTAANQRTANRGELKPQFSESGRTQMTAQNAKTRFNIADDNDDVNM